MLSIDPILNGLVIDHIKAGTALDLYNLLELDTCSGSVALLQNLYSKKYGKKDLIKIETTCLPEKLDILGYIDENITLIYIKNGEVIKKEHPRLPQKMVNVICCSNPRCITSVEQGCEQIFTLSKSGKYRCIYCNAEYQEEKES